MNAAGITLCYGQWRGMPPNDNEYFSKKEKIFDNYDRHLKNHGVLEMVRENIPGSSKHFYQERRRKK